MAGKKRKVKLFIDTHEKDTELARLLLNDNMETEVKGGVGYDPTGDYIIVDKEGNTWGIERKSFLDCYQSIIDGRIYGQLSQLISAYPNRAIFLLESPNYFPPSLKVKRHQIMQMVLTFFSERSMLLPCWYVLDAKHGAHLIKKFANEAHDIKIHGRNIIISVEMEE